MGCGDDGKPDTSAPDGSPPVDSSDDAGSAAKDDGGVLDASTPDADVPPQDLVPVTLRFKAVLGDEPLTCGSTYTSFGATGVDVELKDLRMFLQDVALLREDDGQPEKVWLDSRAPFQTADVALLDFEDGSAACAAQGTPETNLTITGKVAPGTYAGVAFTNGVPEALNHQNPLDLTAPLQEGPMHWNWQGGFLFVRTELARVGAGGSEGSALMHVGSTACSGSPAASEGYSCELNNRNRITLQDFDPETQTILVDVGALFSDLDLSQTTTCHSEQPACESMFSAAGINFGAGDAGETQSLFRVQ